MSSSGLVWTAVGAAGGAAGIWLVGSDIRGLVFGALIAFAAVALRKTPAGPEPPAGLPQATFAAGCFWGVELAFQRVPGVVSTTVGYTQGHTDNPVYDQVKRGETGHVEAVLVRYDPGKVRYEQLLDTYWDRSKVGGVFDPTKPNQQGNDKGSQYRSGIYWHSQEQKAAAEASVQAAPGRLKLKPWLKVHVEVRQAVQFFPAEESHQRYLSDKGGRKGAAQNPAKGCCDQIRCYG